MDMNPSDSVRYIGVDDLDLDLFESQYPVPNGISYNSYIILDEKVAILDTVDARCTDQWINNLMSALGGRNPDYLVSHHMEPDHSALIAKVMEMWPGIKLVASAMAIKYVQQFHEGLPIDGRAIAVKEGDTLDLGTHKLQFLFAPMVHWPEVIMAYETTERLLFTSDAFGTFGAICRYDGDWKSEARRYYINICGKYGPQVQTVLKKLAKCEINKICPLHGPVLTSPLVEYLDLYNTWSTYKPEEEGVLVAVASIHGGTMEAAKVLARMLCEGGEPKVEVMDLARCDMSEAVAMAFCYDKMVLCAASYDADVFPPMREFIEHLCMKGYRSRKVGLMENGTWAPTAGKVMRTLLESAKDLVIVEPMVTLRSKLRKCDYDTLAELVRSITSTCNEI